MLLVSIYMSESKQLLNFRITLFSYFISYRMVSKASDFKIPQVEKAFSKSSVFSGQFLEIRPNRRNKAAISKFSGAMQCVWTGLRYIKNMKYLKAHLHDIHFSHGTPNFWQAGQ